MRSMRSRSSAIAPIPWGASWRNTAGSRASRHQKPLWVGLQGLLARIAALDPAHRIDTQVEERLEACVDEDQLEQALINLVKNAAEAQGEVTQPIALVARADGDFAGDRRARFGSGHRQS